MKILLIGSGGREHALAWRLKQNPAVELFSAPGSSALAKLGQIRPAAIGDVAALTAVAEDLRPDLTVIGPELPLSLGLADALRSKGLAVFGPSAAAAEIECSKIFAKDFMVRHNLPTASYAVFYDHQEARQYLKHSSYPAVVKADGLAGGKGVIICGQHRQALAAIDALAPIPAAERLIIEEYLAGDEISFFALADGRTAIPFGSAQDHKAVHDYDRGPNTGGMGACSPSPLVTPALEKTIMDEIIRPAIEGLAIEGRPYCGLLYAGLVRTLNGLKILEFNARFGDPETQAVLPRFKGDLAEVMMAAAQGRLEQVSPTWDPRPAVCVVMSAEGYPGPSRQGDAIAGLEQAAARPDVEIFEAGVTREVRQGAEIPVTSGGRVLAVSALGDNMPDAVQKAYEAVSLISFEGAHYRRDIAAKAAKQAMR
ncbi:MAG: phosphoribosylamine--glycine ligase [Deltaproteobacteria bacterium]|jgi:phosphoribosylamine--glycine ligase|nr:phosphoribosylamine--glycine ligase [Deltaproteobacteria bacterium]